MVKKAADGAANKIRRLSSLSTEQVLNIQLQREEYLANLEKINPEDKTASEITERILAANSIEIYNAYLPQIKELDLPVQKDIDFEEEVKADFNITPHVFRHSKAVHMVRAGINLIYIRDFLGHVDCYTTEIYARIDTETKRKAIERACKDIFPEGKTTDWTADEDLMSFLETLV